MLPYYMQEEAEVALVVPVFNEEELVFLFVQRICETCVKSLPNGVRLSIFFVDDGSTDDTWKQIKEQRIAFKAISIRGIRLTRNYGKEAALFAGLSRVNAAAVIPMDIDLQDPAEIVPILIEKWKSGAKTVVAKRRHRREDTLMKRITARFFYKVYNGVADFPIPENVGDFRIMDKSIVEKLVLLPDFNKFMKGMYSYVSRAEDVVEFDRPKGLRKQDDPRQTLSKLVDLAELAITSAGPKVFRKLLKFELFIGVLLFLYLMFIVASKAFFGTPFEGFTSLIVLISITSLMQIGMLSILGVIASRIYLESKRRPGYFVAEHIN